MTAERLRAARGIAGRVAFALVVYVIAFFFSFPYGRIREQVIAVAAQRDMDVQIGSAGPLFGVGIAFHDIKVAKRVPEGKRPQPLRIDEARVRVSPLARLFGETAVSVAADALGGALDVDFQASKTSSRVRLNSQDLSIGQLPGIKEAINIPLFGKLAVGADLGMPTGRLAETTGNLTWSCAACAIGDGKSKLKVAGVLEEGLDLPRLRLGELAGRVVFEKGVGKLQGVQARSPDGEISVEGEIRLADPLPYSQIDLYVRFKLSDALLKSSDKLGLMMQLGDAMGGKAPDGAYGVRLTGSFAHLLPPRWAKSSPFAGGAAPGRPSPPHSGPARRSGFAPSRLGADPTRDQSANLPHYPPPTPAEVKPLTPPTAPPTPAGATFGAAPPPASAESAPPPRLTPPAPTLPPTTGTPPTAIPPSPPPPPPPAPAPTAPATPPSNE
jgi:type II secretion system protein N